MELTPAPTTSWPTVTLALGLVTLGIFLTLALLSNRQELRKLKITAGQEDALRQLVRRYEQLAENTMDAQQRAGADLAELRSRTASIEQILRTVE